MRVALFRPGWERMEDRTLLATMIWTNSAGGDWDLASNWVNAANSSDEHVPTASDIAEINMSGVTVKHDTSAVDSVGSLTLVSGASLDVSDGSLSIASASTIDGNLSVTGGATVGVGGAFTLASSSQVTANGSTLVLGDSQGDAWSNAGTITATNSTVDLGGSFTPAGLGSFTPSETTVNLTGTVNNAGATLAFSARRVRGTWREERSTAARSPRPMVPSSRSPIRAPSTVSPSTTISTWPQPLPPSRSPAA